MAGITRVAVNDGKSFSRRCSTLATAILELVQSRRMARGTSRMQQESHIEVARRIIAIVAAAFAIAAASSCAGNDGEPATLPGMLVEPPAFVGNTSAARLLWQMYPDTAELVLCREEVESGRLGNYVVHGLTEGSELPEGLRALMDRVSNPDVEFSYLWFGLRRITILEQEWVVSADGREGPWASVAVLALLRNPESGSIVWVLRDGAAVELCHVVTANDL